MLVDRYGDVDGYGVLDALGEVAVVPGPLGACPVQVRLLLSAPDLDVGVDPLDPVSVGVS